MTLLMLIILHRTEGIAKLLEKRSEEISRRAILVVEVVEVFQIETERNLKL